MVMDFMEHDLKGLMNAMPSPFTASEVKRLMVDLISALSYCTRHSDAARAKAFVRANLRVHLLIIIIIIIFRLTPTPSLERICVCICTTSGLTRSQECEPTRPP